MGEQPLKIPAACFLLAGLTPGEREPYLRQVAPGRSFEKGAVIYATDRFQRALGILAQGEAQVVRFDAEGHRIIMNTLHEGDSFGAAALFDAPESYVSTVVAVQPCQVWFLPEETLEEWMRRDWRIARNYIAFLSGRIRFLNRRIAGFTGGSSQDRVLLYLQQHRGADGRVELPFSRSDLAKVLDVGRSSLYRSLDALEETGVIRREGKQIWVL